MEHFADGESILIASRRVCAAATRIMGTPPPKSAYRVFIPYSNFYIGCVRFGFERVKRVVWICFDIQYVDLHFPSYCRLFLILS